jgi:ribonuclease VapC
MILDSSALVAVVLREPEQDRMLERMDAATRLGIGAPTLVETAIVLSARLATDARGLVSRLLIEGNIAVVPFTDAHFGVALTAWLRYGRGRHPAQLNCGDCLAYATARVAREPLLFTGEDFARTDVEAA